MEYYRLCHSETKQGLWYDQLGVFTGLIHNSFNFCQNKDLKMDYDSELVGYLSATSSLEDLFKWFSKEDILKLQEHGYLIHVYESGDVKFYNKFQHLVINQSNSKLIKTIKL